MQKSERKSSSKIEIIFVTGKGGVGKSTVAAGIALSQALRGKKCLLVELGNQSFFKDYFQLPKVGYEPQSLRPGLDLALWSGPECLREYAKHLLKIESLYRLFFENPVTRALVNVAPGLPEISILGKITSGPPRNVGPRLDYDCLVVDAYATGHFLALIRAPQGMAQTVSFGPMGEQSRAIDAVISDGAITKYVVVSIPEELPVTEALELSEKIEKQVRLRPLQVLNRQLAPADEGGSAEFIQAMKTQQQQQSQALQRLQGFQVIALPFVLENQSWKVVEALAQEFERQNQKESHGKT
jgi:anion-transporting  ArsA/GET3 family ATPase